MASNSEANLSSDFDIDGVINWDEQNYSSKGIEFQLPQLGLASDVKTSQNTTVTLPNLGSAVTTSQGAQNSSSFYSSLFGVANNPSIVRNSKNHGFSSRQTMVSPNTLSFPSENISIPSIATSNSSLLQFSPNLVGQNSPLVGQLCMPPMQNVQNNDNLINDDVSPFDDNDDLFEGPLDRIVDQIIDRQNSERITEPPSLSNTFDDDTPVITYSNRQAKASQLSRNVSPQNVPLRSVLSPNAPSRNVTSSTVPSSNIPICSSPSPNAPTLVSSPGNPTQNILSPNPPSRNVPVQDITTTTTKIIPPNVSPPNVPSQNVPLPIQHSSGHAYSTIRGHSSQSNEQGIPSQLHSKFRLQSPVSVPSTMVNTLGQTTMKGPPALKPVTNLPVSLGQTELSTNSLFQSSSGQEISQSYPSFMLQNPNQTLIQQPAATFSPNSTQPKSMWSQSGSSLEDLLRMQTSIRTSSPNLGQTEFTNQLARSSPNFSSALSNPIGSEQSHSNVQSLLTTNIGTENSTALFPNVSDTTSDLQLKISTSSSPNPAGVNLSGQNINADISQFFNRTSDSNPKSVSNQSQTSVPQHVTYPGQAVSIFGGTNSGSSSLTGSQDDELQITSIGQTIQNPKTQPLASPQQTVTSVNQFFIQNSSNVAESTADINRNENVFSNTISQSHNVVVSNNPNSTKLETPSNPQQSKSVFTLVPAATTLSPTEATPSVLFKNQANPVNSKPAGITTIKITSPSLNTAGFKYPTVGFSPNPAPKAVSIQPPRTTTIRLKSPTTTTFPTFRLTQDNLTTSGSTPNTKPMVFTLPPGAQATLKGLPTNLKDKLTGRQVIFLQQPSGQPINTPKPQPMKIVFVNDGSIAHVVSGPVKSKAPQSSAAPVVSRTPDLTVTSKITQPLTEGKHVLPASTEVVPESDAGSPSSVNSADSDSIPIAALKQNNSLKRKEDENKDGTEQKTRGRKRRKDPNRPVKPLSSFQRFFQATQPTIRQQNPQATFAEVSKTIKEMWESLSSKDKKVYQDAWRMERVQYKKAMDDYNAGLNEIDSIDCPSAKQAKRVEIKDDLPTVNPIPASPVDIPMKTENPTITSPTATPANLVVPSSIPPPRSTGKPLAMMAEMANKTKLASAHAAKATAMTKSLHLGKSKASNGVEDSGTHVVKKKAKINPIPKKSCIRTHCNKPAKTTKERGTMFCSDDCLMRYCRGIFKSWVDTRRQTLKAAT